jgi:hypothetical protein
VLAKPFHQVVDLIFREILVKTPMALGALSCVSSAFKSSLRGVAGTVAAAACGVVGAPNALARVAGDDVAGATGLEAGCGAGGGIAGATGVTAGVPGD